MLTSTSENPTNGPCLPRPAIAIVGMGCRWPGGVHSPSELWDLLKDKRDGWKEFSPEHINLDGFYHPNGQRSGSIYTKGGHILQEDPRLFDHSFFGISATETKSLDPVQRKLLEVTYEAFENAGEPFDKFYGSKTGVFVGNFNNDHQIMQYRDPDFTQPYVVTGSGTTILSNRINYVFNLQGPSLTVDTGCSASMYALHLAVLSIENGDCDQAIVAGGNLILGADGQIFTTKLGALSPTSRCHTFDASADGYSRADGFGALYLKKVSDAISNGDPIRAVIRGTAFNANGKTSGISHPSSDGQAAVIRQAYKVAGNLDPALTGYFECHGTGTPVGDPIEVSAIGNVFASGRAKEPLLIGSVKPNLGHGEASSAMLQIMKAILSMEHGQIPATIGITKLNPTIDFDAARVKVVTDLTPWPKGLLRRVSINSFGYGGANAHCILDHPSIAIPDYQSRANRLNDNNKNGNVAKVTDFLFSQPVKTENCEQAGVRRLVLLPVSAEDEVASQANLLSAAAHFDDIAAADILYTLGCRRSKLSRGAFAVADPEDFKSGLDFSIHFAKIQGSPVQRIGFLFTGQGTQWPQMGMRLFEEYTVFRETIRHLDQALSCLRNKPDWTIEDALRQPAETSRVHQPVFSQTLGTALQIGIVNLLKQWNVLPSATLGHSSGEIAAAYAAGYLQASEAIVIAFCRGQAVASNQRKGLMLAVGLGVDEIAPFLEDTEQVLQIAAFNSPTSITVSGDSAAVEDLALWLTSEGIFNRILQTGGNAYHSHHMRALGEAYEQILIQSLEDISKFQSTGLLDSPPVPWFSSVTLQKRSAALDPSYWRRNLESPVFFSQAAEKLAAETDNPVQLFVEIGPHPALIGPLRQLRAHLQQSEITLPRCFGTLSRESDDMANMLELAGNLFLSNAPVDLVAVNSTETVRDGTLFQQHGNLCQGLPYKFTYPEQPIYFENRISKEYRTRQHPRHDLLGARIPGTSKLRPSWRNVLRFRNLTWLDHHRLTPHMVLPASVYFAMAIEAMFQMHNDAGEGPIIRSFKLRNVTINAALNLPVKDFGVETILNMEPATLHDSAITSAWHKFTISSLTPDDEFSSEGTWTDHCTGMIRAEVDESIIEQNIQLRLDPRSRSLDVKRWYQKFSDFGLAYGPAFQGLSHLKAYRRVQAAAASVSLHSTSNWADGEESRYLVHPAALDNCLQLGLIACHSGQVENMKNAFVPVFAKEITVWVPDSQESNASGIARGKLLGSRGAYIESQLYSSSGNPLVHIPELKCISYRGESERSLHVREPFMRPVLRPDFTTLRDNRFWAMFSSEVLNERMIFRFDKYSKAIIANIKTNLPSLVPENMIQRHAGFVSWILDASQRSDLPLDNDHDTDVLGSSLISKMEMIPEESCIKLLHENLGDIISGETNGAELLMDHDLLNDLYSSAVSRRGSHVQLQHILSLLAHKSPRMRILEVDAGTGASTVKIQEVLKGSSPSKLFESYVCTDARDWCLSEAEVKLQGQTGITFQVLDLAKDPSEQGFDEHSFDLVISGYGLGHYSDPVGVLKTINRLLKPNKGTLIMSDITFPNLGLEMLSRTLNEQWMAPKIFYDKSSWHNMLYQAQFSGIDFSLQVHVDSQALSTVMLASVAGTGPSKLKLLSKVYIVYKDRVPPIALLIKKYLVELGAKMVFVNVLTDQVPPNSTILSFVDIESITILHHGKKYFNAIHSLLSNCAQIFWVSLSSGSEAAAEPAIMKGLLRSAANSYVTANFVFFELYDDYHDFFDLSASFILRKLIELALSPSAATFDREYVIRKGTLFIERLMPDDTLNEEFRIRNQLDDQFYNVDLGDQGPLRAAYAEPGQLSSLYFAKDETADEPLPSDWIEIRMKAIGVNTKDIAVALGKYDSEYLSLEGSGTVTAVGPEVTDFAVGDNVFGLILANMGNYARTQSSLVARIPERTTFTAAASMPLAYTTALYSLDRLARLQAGESVLIQSASGGLGMAAIRIAQHLGAEIYVTAGSAEKGQMLTDKFGIPPSRIFSSRNISSVGQILSATKQKGIDVILSSASGDLMREYCRCIAPQGRFIDVGRLDVLSSGTFQMDIFKRNATFSSFDMCWVFKQNPSVISSLTQEMLELWNRGVIGPIDPITTFDISQMVDAMTYFSKRTHVGKIVLTLDNPKTTLKILKSAESASFDPNATYLLVGALGGLGKSLSVWMVERGARHLVFLSRSRQDKPGTSTILEELKAMGASPEVVSCSVTDLEELNRVVGSIPKERPLKGIIHAAMVEADGVFDHLKYDQLHSALSPKVTGSINLHKATQHIPLDFFIMTSSLASTVGTATQAAYTAANSFQDSFARYRVEQGLPAKSIGIGLVLEVGSVRDATGFQDMFQRKVTYGLSETEFLQLFEQAFLQSSLNGITSKDPSSIAQITLGLEPGRFVDRVESGQINDLVWGSNSRFQVVMQSILDKFIHTYQKSLGDVTSEVSKRLDMASSESERLEILRHAIVERLASLVSVDADDIDIQQPISRYGVDSLVAAELRSWLVKTLGIKVTLLQLLNKTLKVDDIVKINL